MIFTDGMVVVDANLETLTDHRPLLKAQSFMEPSNARSMKLCDRNEARECEKRCPYLEDSVSICTSSTESELYAWERQALR